MIVDHPELEVTIHRASGQRRPIGIRLLYPGSDAEQSFLRETQACWDDEEALPSPEMMDLDLKLADTLFKDAVLRRALDEGRAAARATGLLLRLRLRFAPGAEHLHGLPWELLRDPERLEDPEVGRLLAASGDIVFSRVIGSSDWRPIRVRTASEVRALIVIANPGSLESPWNLSPIDVQGEMRRALDSLGRIPARALASGGSATLEGLIEALREGYDVLYLVCHGEWRDGDPQLWLENGTGKPTSGREFVERIEALSQRPTLVVLASCQSAASGAALGPLLAKAGIPAVLAMQGEVPQETAFAFMADFFRELRDHGEIDRASSSARRIIRHLPGAWMPVLYLRLRNGRLWEEGDPGLAHWLDNLERLRKLGQISEEDVQDLLAWLTGGPVPLTASRSDFLRRLSARPGVIPEEEDLRAARLNDPCQARRHQILAAIHYGLKVRVEKLDLPFLLIPPGRSASVVNEEPFYLAETPVSQSVWAAVMGGTSHLSDRDRPQAGIRRSEIERFFERANQCLAGEAVLLLPAPAQLSFVREVTGPAGAASRSWHGEPRLKAGSASAFGLYDVEGVVYQLCREGNSWSWWGGSFATPEVDFSDSPPSIPSHSAWERSRDYGFRPALRLGVNAHPPVSSRRSW